jgi:hypothetical protein
MNSRIPGSNDGYQTTSYRYGKFKYLRIDGKDRTNLVGSGPTASQSSYN